MKYSNSENIGALEVSSVFYILCLSLYIPLHPINFSHRIVFKISWLADLQVTIEWSYWAGDKQISLGCFVFYTLLSNQWNIKSLIFPYSNNQWNAITHLSLLHQPIKCPNTSFPSLWSYLHNQWSIFWTGLHGLFPVVRIPHKNRRVKHGGVTQLCSVFTTQHPPGQLASIHHWRHNVLGRVQGPSPKVKPRELSLILRKH
jgi:hypothetical protein